MTKMVTVGSIGPPKAQPTVGGRAVGLYALAAR